MRWNRQKLVTIAVAVVLMTLFVTQQFVQHPKTGLLMIEEEIRFGQENKERQDVSQNSISRQETKSEIKRLNISQPGFTTSQFNDSCKPQHTILFLKTHKTGSSTITSILQVYGFLRNLTFAVPKTGAQVLSVGFFKPKQVHPGKYNMLVNHVRYNRSAMEQVMKPGAKFITILRDPTTQIESNFGYFFLTKYFELENERNPFRKFLSNPSYYWNTYKRVPFRNYMKNPNLFDLGLSEAEQEDIVIVKKYIERISQEFDLVLIQEYFNESLLLLRKLLCWKMEDIVYLSKGTRSSKIRFEIESELRDSIRKWSWADALLYEYFNQTFWEKVQEYGPSFKADLAEFESRLNETLYNCTLTGSAPPVDNRRETFYRKNPKGGPKCPHLMRSDLDFTKLLRRLQYGEE